MGRLGSLRSIGGNNINLIEMTQKTNIDEVIDKCNRTQKRMGNNQLFNLGQFDKKTGRKLKNFEGKDTLTYDELSELRETSDIKKISFASLMNMVDDENDEYADEYICDCCPHRCKEYNQDLCDSCNDCEECSEYMDNECSGCSFSVHRDNSYYWERHPDIIHISKSDETILDILNSDDVEFKSTDFSSK